jgi:hypothetical protein
MFLDGLIGPLNYQLQSHTFQISRHWCTRQLGWKARGRNWASRNTSSSHMDSQAVTLVLASVHSRVCLSTVLVDKVEGMQLQRSFQPQRFNPQTPRAPTPQQSHSNNGSGAPVRNTTPVQPNGCFKCGELGHYANNCPKRTMLTHRENGHRSGQPS